jgi:hypothetical protein
MDFKVLQLRRLVVKKGMGSWCSYYLRIVEGCSENLTIPFKKRREISNAIWATLIGHIVSGVLF